METLSALIAEQVPKMQEVKNLAAEVKSIKMNVAKSKPATDSPELRQAMKEAKAATEEFGPTSPEARVAWDNVEEIASSGLQNAMGTRLDEECLLDSAQEACEALDELSRAISVSE